MKALLTSLLLLLSLTGCSSTKYATFDPTTGNRLTEFKTNANVGIMTSRVAESNSSTGGGLPLLSGGYTNDMLTDARENVYPSGITFPDGTTISGTLDHATMADVQGHWVWRNVRSIMTGAVFLKGLGVYGDNQAAAHATDQLGITQGNTTARAVDANATQVAIKQIEATAATEALPFTTPTP